MKSLCGADCASCPSNKNCKGCESKKCFVADYIKTGGLENYKIFKNNLLCEINNLLVALGIPKAESLYELCGEFVNLPYMLPSGECVPFLDNQKIYLGTQIEFAQMGICYGVVADTNFILVCSYSVNGSEPELITYKKR